MIFFERPLWPEFVNHLETIKRQKEINNYIEECKNGNIRYKLNSPFAHLGGFIRALRSKFGDKCLYCECSLLGLPDSEYMLNWFRPVEQALVLNENLVFQFRSTPHYFWLQWEWHNIYLSCELCARAKNDQFPIAGPLASIGSIGSALREERALILDPCDKDNNPLTELRFRSDGSVEPFNSTSKRGKTTIEIFKLNERSDLLQQRKAAILEVDNIFETCKQSRGSSARQIDDFDRLIAACGVTQPFAGARRWHLRALLEGKQRPTGKRWLYVRKYIEQWFGEQPSSPPTPVIYKDSDGFDFELQSGKSHLEVKVVHRPFRESIERLPFNVSLPKVNIDYTALRSFATDIDEYSKLLSAKFFRDIRVSNALSYAIGRVEEGKRTLLIRLKVPLQHSLLHNVRWELLKDPMTGEWLGRKYPFVRAIEVGQEPRGRKLENNKPMALIALAVPSNGNEHYSLPLINKESLRETARNTLEGYEIDVLNNTTRNTLRDRLRKGVDVLCIYSHGITTSNNMPALYFEDSNSETAPITAHELAEIFRSVSLRPRLVVLAACNGAGRSDNIVDSHVAIGPLIAASGVEAVVAFYDLVSLKTLEIGLPILFRHLLKEGNIELAMLEMRIELAIHNEPWWQAVLFLKLLNGNIFSSLKKV